MKLKNIIENDEYLTEKKDRFIKIWIYLKHQWLYLLGIFFITFVASLTTFTSVSYFNNNSQQIEARALTAYTEDINEVTLRSTINYGVYPNDVFSGPDNQIIYLQEKHRSIKTYKVYNAYESYRATDTINGFYYMGNPADKPTSTYYDRFNDNVRMYTNFLCINDGSYLDIELEYSANPVMVDDVDEDGNVIGSHREYKYMVSYIGNEIYLPYDFAVNTLLPQYQNGYFGHDEDMELEDLVGKEFILFSVMANRLTVTGSAYDQTETPVRYIIRGITKDDTSEAYRNYFIVPFSKSMLTQPRVYFRASASADDNNAYMSDVLSFNSNSSLKWGISTRFSAPLKNYVNTNAPAKRVGIFIALTIMILVADGFVFYLYLKNVTKNDLDTKISFTSISSVIVLFFSILFGAIIAKAIDGSALFAWATSIGRVKTVFFGTTSSIINCIFGLVLIIAALVAAIKFLKFYKNKKETEVLTKDEDIQQDI